MAITTDCYMTIEKMTLHCMAIRYARYFYFYMEFYSCRWDVRIFEWLRLLNNSNYFAINTFATIYFPRRTWLSELPIHKHIYRIYIIQ